MTYPDKLPELEDAPIVDPEPEPDAHSDEDESEKLPGEASAPEVDE